MVADPSLAARLRALVAGAPAAWDGDAALAQALADALARAREAWPELALADAPLLAAIAGALDPAGDPTTALTGLHAGDLALARLAVAGDPRAIACLERQLERDIRPALHHLGLSPTTVDDVLGDLLDDLLVRGPGEDPRIAGYRGRGPLRRWIRTIAVRRAYRAAAPSASAGDEPLAALPDGDDVELAALRRRYDDAFQRAFVEALAALEPRQRNLLRYHLLDRLTVDELGALYRIHRATAARWVAGARQALLDGTRERLRLAVGATPAEVDSLIRLIRSQLDVSLHRLLGAG